MLPRRSNLPTFGNPTCEVSGAQLSGPSNTACTPGPEHSTALTLRCMCCSSFAWPMPRCSAISSSFGASSELKLLTRICENVVPLWKQRKLVPASLMSPCQHWHSMARTQTITCYQLAIRFRSTVSAQHGALSTPMFCLARLRSVCCMTRPCSCTRLSVK